MTATTSTLTLTSEQAELIESALLVVTPSAAVSRLLDRVRRAQKRIKERGKNIDRPARGARAAAAATGERRAAPLADPVPGSPPGERSDASAAARLAVDKLPAPDGRVAPKRGVDHDMRYSDRGKLTDEEAAALRRRFLAAQSEPASRWHFAPPEPARETLWQRVKPFLIGAAWTGGVVAVIAAVVLFATASVRAHERWIRWCHAQGGHVTSTSDTRVGTAIVNGKITAVVTTDTTHYCLAAGGAVLDIR